VLEAVVPLLVKETSATGGRGSLTTARKGPALVPLKAQPLSERNYCIDTGRHHLGVRLVSL
jgi:hypothetical protein